MEKVVLAMSGGVDSSVAAYLLIEQGYEVVGVTMQVWQPEDALAAAEHGGCCGITAVDDARQVCNKLGIQHYVLNFREAFKTDVIEPFVQGYMAGITPNPCIACNRYVKWQHLYNKAKLLDADFIATGHYANIAKHDQTCRLSIQASQSAKDQSYALYNLSQQALAKTLFPLTNMPKDEVRKIASEHLGMHMAQKPDSQEICFVPYKDHATFLIDKLGELPRGNFVDMQGNVLKPHDGIGRYTIVQRKGLGAFGKPMFVQAICATTHNVTLSDNEQDLFTKTMTLHDINFMTHASIDAPMQAHGKIRYAHKPAQCTITQKNNEITATFNEPQRAITPGQSAVFYDANGLIICGGIIK